MGESTPQSLISRAEHASFGSSPWVLRSTVNEVAVFFAATDRGKSVSDLTRQEVVIRDDGKPPAAVIAFLNEAKLPLRLGLVIDTSSSIIKQFAFEQKAAASFLQKVVTETNDLAFVVGFTSDVLLVQDFTGDEARISHGIDQLAPAGGTALWDAVKFASDKLASRPEQQPVAKILVVISDGEDNASAVTLKQAIENAERAEVIIYTVSTREFAGGDVSSPAPDHAMKALAARTGGAAFFPGSVSDLDRRLADLQQVIRSRYLISYKPAHFEANGSYHSIGIGAEKSGHKLRVYARRGYYAHAKPAEGQF
jgi:VWFA-related protein